MRSVLMASPPAAEATTEPETMRASTEAERLFTEGLQWRYRSQSGMPKLRPPQRPCAASSHAIRSPIRASPSERNPRFLPDLGPKNPACFLVSPAPCGMFRRGSRWRNRDEDQEPTKNAVARRGHGARSRECHTG